MVSVAEYMDIIKTDLSHLTLREKLEYVPEYMKRYNSANIIGHKGMTKLTEEFLQLIDYEFVRVSNICPVKAGDEYLRLKNHWFEVTEEYYDIHVEYINENSCIVRRPTEHRKMSKFFFGT